MCDAPAEHHYCHLCGKGLHRYRIYRRMNGNEPGIGLVVCDRCERERSRCAVCDVPMAEASQDKMCPACRQDAPACLVCGRPIPGAYVYVGDSGPYCEVCHRTRPHCDVCGAPVGEPAQVLADGRTICSHCHQTAVCEPQQAHEIYQRTVGIIQQSLGLYLNVPTEFILADRHQIAELMQEEPRRAAPESSKQNTLGLFRRRGRQRGVYVEYGLPQILLIQVIAHEYAHAWQGENCPLLRERTTKEGFAEWVAYKVLQALGAVKKMAVMEARQDRYGQGLRHFLAVEAARGVGGVLDYCRSTR